jgi:glycine cleavage system transcriptional repressor
MRHFAVAAVGRDRPGIVAAVSDVLYAHGANLEDSQMAILRGHFAMMLVIAAPDGIDVARLRTDLEAVRDRLDLDSATLAPVSEAPPGASPTHVVSVYGADRRGIVRAVAGTLAARGVSITDLQTQLSGGSPDAPLYALMAEIALPPGVGPAELEAELTELARAQGLEVSVRALDAAAL